MNKKEKIKQKINAFFGEKIAPFLGKLVLVWPFHGLITRLFIFGNKELYRRSLTESPVLKFSVSGYWDRAPMYAAIHNFFEKLSKKENLKNKIAIEIGGSERSIKAILEKFGVNYEVADNFPKIDIHRLPYADNTFDFLITDQVLEHVEKPWIAVKEIFRVLKPEGISIATGPFMVGDHGWEKCKDYYRYTPDGWRSLFSDFKILEVDGWGNREVVRLSLDSSVEGVMFGAHIPVTEVLKKKLLENNDKKSYLVTWCIARKPFGK